MGGSTLATQGVCKALPLAFFTTPYTLLGTQQMIKIELINVCENGLGKNENTVGRGKIIVFLYSNDNYYQSLLN